MAEIIRAKVEEVITSPTGAEDIDVSDQAAVKKFFLDNFDFVPNDAELFLGLLHAYQKAAVRIETERKIESQNKKKAEIMKMWTYDEMKKTALVIAGGIAEKEGFDFVLDKDNQEVFHLLCLYFTNDKKFETYGYGGKNYSLKKGIWLQSPTRGTGKSVLLRCFYHNKRQCFGYKHTTELANMFQKQGFNALDFYMKTLPQPANALNFYQTEAGFMYDELFGEPKVNHMGSPLQVSEYILNSLYDFSNNYKGNMWKFHVTSNYDGNDIEQKSGPNYRSRMADMFNLIKLEGKDRR